MIDDRKPERLRLDQALVERGLFETRSRARDAVLRGLVTVDGAVAGKPSLAVGTASRLEVGAEAGRYVSRAAAKLAAALDHFGYDSSDRIALDLGASTGGFTEVLLERGAARVYAVDVGHDQLHPRLRDDARVLSLEGLNARDLTTAEIGEAVGAITADMSFISLRLALPPALALAAPDAFAVLLFKPQFELGREALGKGGIVRDHAAAENAAQQFAAWLAEQHGWQIDGVIDSPLPGGDGNREFLIGARHG